MNKKLLKEVTEKAKGWLAMKNVDSDTKKEIERMIAEQGDELIDSFYKVLEFGTGGLRGIMGVGSNRMNIYTVAMSTQGLCNYLKKAFSNRNKFRLLLPTIIATMVSYSLILRKRILIKRYQSVSIRRFAPNARAIICNSIFTM